MKLLLLLTAVCFDSHYRYCPAQSRQLSAWDSADTTDMKPEDSKNRNMKLLFRAVRRQFLFFLIYLFVFSLSLFNHKGGADILFIFLIAAGMIIHCIIVISKSLNDKNKIAEKRWSGLDIFAFLFIVLIFIFTYQHYLNFMWWLTSGF